MNTIFKRNLKSRLVSGEAIPACSTITSVVLCYPNMKQNTFQEKYRPLLLRKGEYMTNNYVHLLVEWSLHILSVCIYSTRNACFLDICPHSYSNPYKVLSTLHHFLFHPVFDSYKTFHSVLNNS